MQGKKQANVSELVQVAKISGINGIKNFLVNYLAQMLLMTMMIQMNWIYKIKYSRKYKNINERRVTEKFFILYMNFFTKFSVAE